jgi:hypothetical protein
VHGGAETSSERAQGAPDGRVRERQGGCAQHRLARGLPSRRFGLVALRLRLVVAEPRDELRDVTWRELGDADALAEIGERITVQVAAVSPLVFSRKPRRPWPW